MRLGTLLKKELLEYWRTYRAVALGVVFVIFGLLSPLAARYMPEVFSGMDMGGIVIQLPTPTPADGNTQFVKNMSQIVAIVSIDSTIPSTTRLSMPFGGRMMCGTCDALL